MKRITKITLLTALLFVSVSSLPTAVAEKPVQFGLTVQPIFPCGALKPSLRVGPSVECILPDNLQLIPRIQAIIEAHVMLAGHSQDSSLQNHEKGQVALNVQPDLGVKPMPDNPWFPKMSWRPYLSYGSGGMHYSVVQFGLQWKHKNCRISLTISRVPTGTPAGGETAGTGAEDSKQATQKAEQAREALKKAQEKLEAAGAAEKAAAQAEVDKAKKAADEAAKAADEVKPKDKDPKQAAQEKAKKAKEDLDKAKEDLDKAKDAAEKAAAQAEVDKAKKAADEADAAVKAADEPKKAANPQSDFWKGWNVGLGFTWYF